MVTIISPKSMLERGTKYHAEKNSKMENPVFGFLTKVLATFPGEENPRVVGRLVYQQGHTCCAPPYSNTTSTWEVFGIDQTWEESQLVKLRFFRFPCREWLEACHPQEQKEWAMLRSEGLKLTRSSGQVTVLAGLIEDDPALPLWNNKKLPATFRTVWLTLELTYPTSQKEAECLWMLIPFNNGGGPESPRNECPYDLYQREIVSYWALTDPDAYRALVKEQFSLAGMTGVAEQALGLVKKTQPVMSTNDDSIDD